jgi:hypothetical protein
MKSLFTISAIAALTAASFGAQAQFTVDGTLSANEIGTGSGKYQLVASYAGTHSAGNRGLSALYMGTTATTVNFMVVASPEKFAGDPAAVTDYNALVLYLDMPNKAGIAAGTKLPLGTDGTSQLSKAQPTMDMQVDYGFRVTVSPSDNADVYHSKLDFTAALVGGKAPDVYLGSTKKTGAAFTVTDNATSGVAGAKISYKTTPTGNVTTNTNSGWEIEYPLAALGGAKANDVLKVFVGYLSDPGAFYSDVLPQVAGQTTALGMSPDFTAKAGNQFASYTVTASGLATRAATAALKASVYPNPVAAGSRLAYTIPNAAQAVSVEVFNGLGQKVTTLLSATQAAGPHTLELAPLQKLAAGSYLVNLRVGKQLSTHRVTVE